MMATTLAALPEADENAVGALRVLISDKIAPECVALFGEVAGIDLDYKPGLSGDDLLACIGEYNGLIVRSATQVTADVLAKAKRLQAVVRAGVGVDNIDVGEATKRGVLVMNCPQGNTVAAAEHTIALLLAAARNIPQAHAALKQGRWERSQWMGTEVTGKVLGLLGLGKVGCEVARRGLGLGMRVVCYDPFVGSEQAKSLGVRTAECEDVLKEADFLSVHVPLTEQTRGLIAARELSMMKSEAVLINVARGGVVDELALAQALEAGVLRAAAIDVFSQEPPSSGHPLLGCEAVIVTPHLGASTREAQEAVGTDSARQLISFLLKDVVVNAVNTVAVEPAIAERISPWRELMQRLGSLQAQLLDGRIRRIRLCYAGALFGGAEREVLGLAFLQGFLRHHVAQPVNAINAKHIANERGLELVEEATERSYDYVNSIVSEVETTGVGDQGVAVRRVAGTLFGQRQPRLVQLDGYATDAHPRGDVLLVSNDDRPGIIGAIGTILGHAGVNIASMSVGRDMTGGTAVAILNVDSAVPEAALDSLRGHDGVLWARTVKL